MRTNLSKFTCSFSDLRWNSQDDMFPSLQAVSTYLHTYAEKFLSPGMFKLNCPVTQVLPRADGKFDVHWTEQLHRLHH